MKNSYRLNLAWAAASTVAFVILTVPGPAWGQHAAPQPMEETAVTSTTSPIVGGAPSIVRAGAKTRAVVVSYNDLNLNNPAGINTLYTRLKTAAREVCSPSDSYRQRAVQRDQQTCYSDAMHAAVADIGNLDLEHYHLAITAGVEPVTSQVAHR